MGETWEEAQSCAPAAPTAKSMSKDWSKALSAPQTPALEHPWGPWHPRTTLLPCSSAPPQPVAHTPPPHHPALLHPMTPGTVAPWQLSHHRSDAACSELARLWDKADPPQLSSPAAQQHVPRMALLPPAGAMARGTAEEVSRGVRP